MSKYEYGRYEGKYGDRVKSRDGHMNADGQYDVKNTRNGDHYFTNTRTGVMGAALGDYRPGRESKDDKDNEDKK